MTPLRIVFMGTPDFACPTLKALIESRHDVVAVFTQPDRPKGRGQQLAPPPVKTLALSHTIPVYQPRRVRAPEVIDQITELSPDVIVVIAFGQILPQALLDIPRLGCINVHASLLPHYRGAAPLNWCLMNGETVTGVTTMLMDAGLDTGPMLLKAETPIREEDNIQSIHDRLSEMGATLLIRTLEQHQEGKLIPIPQDDQSSSYAPLLTKEHGLINWQGTARSIHNQIRALSIWPGSFTFLKGSMLKVYASTVMTGRGEPGTVLTTGNKGLEIACGIGSLLITELQAAGSKRLPAAAYLAGHPITCGTLLGGTPT